MRIDVLPGAIEDIRGLRLTDPVALAAVMTLLEDAETESDNDLIDKFTTRGIVEVGPHRLSVKPWADARRLENLWRIRILDTPATGYRVVYGFNWHQRQIGLLAILKKDDFDYELTGYFAERIFRDWSVATGGKAT